MARQIEWVKQHFTDNFYFFEDDFINFKQYNAS